MTVAHPRGAVRTDVTPTDTAGEYYLYVGRLAEGKGLPALVTAATRTGTRLIICGRGPLRASLEAAAGERITFRGCVRGEPKLRLLREARAFINPSHIEGFGITTVEALLCGTPVIGRDAGHTPWLIIDGVNGHLFDSTTELERLLTTFDADRLAQSHSQIRAAAIASYHPDRFMSTIQTVLDEVKQ